MAGAPVAVQNGGQVSRVYSSARSRGFLFSGQRCRAYRQEPPKGRERPEKTPPEGSERGREGAVAHPEGSAAQCGRRKHHGRAVNSTAVGGHGGRWPCV